MEHFRASGIFKLFHLGSFILLNGADAGISNLCHNTTLCDPSLDHSKGDKVMGQSDPSVSVVSGSVPQSVGSGTIPWLTAHLMQSGE